MEYNVEVILYVADQMKSKFFYESVFQMKPVLEVPGMTEFQLNNSLKLGLMPENGIAKILSDKTPHPSTGSGIPRCELYILGSESNQLFHRALENGAKEISGIYKRSWGHEVGYVSDPDGHILAFAQRPEVSSAPL